MSDEPRATFTPPDDSGQSGWVRLADGRSAYRYADATEDELIIPGALGE